MNKFCLTLTLVHDEWRRELYIYSWRVCAVACDSVRYQLTSGNHGENEEAETMGFAEFINRFEYSPTRSWARMTEMGQQVVFGSRRAFEVIGFTIFWFSQFAVGRHSHSDLYDSWSTIWSREHCSSLPNSRSTRDHCCSSRSLHLSNFLMFEIGSQYQWSMDLATP